MTQLVLTHVIESAATDQALLAEAATAFGGRIHVACPGQCFSIGPALA